MTEKFESMEIHPMRGHSRGEWYCSLDDIAASDQEADYWAVFGTTHRGNKHCLGEFPTKSVAQFAIDGLRKHSNEQIEFDGIDDLFSVASDDWYLYPIK